MSLDNYKESLKNELKPRTVVFLVKENKVLLGYKKRGFGKGYYIGIGGKVEEKESIEDAAIREINEEIHVQIAKESLQEVAILKFYFPHVTDESWNQEVHAFIVKDWNGEPTFIEEIEPRWFEKNELPLDKMWDDAQYWIPQILSGKKVYKEYMFDQDLLVTEHQSFTPLL